MPSSNMNFDQNTGGGGSSGGIGTFSTIRAAVFNRTDFDIRPSGVEENEYNTVTFERLFSDGEWGFTVNTPMYIWYMDIEVGGTAIKRENIRADYGNRLFNSGDLVSISFSSATGNTLYSSYSKTTPGTVSIHVSIKYATSETATNWTNSISVKIGEIKFYNPEVSKITLSGTYQVTFSVGDTFSYAGLVVTATYVYKYSSNSAGSEVVSGYSVSSPNMQTAGFKTVSVYYSDKEANYSITVIDPAPTSWEVQTNFESLLSGLTFYVGDTLDITGLVVTVTPNVGNSFTTTDYQVKLNNSELGNGQLSVAGTNYITVETEYGSSTTQITVNEIEISSISVSTSASFKTAYYTEERLDLTGLTISKTYNNGLTNTVPYTSGNVIIRDGNNVIVEKNKEIDINDHGKTLKVEYSENGVTKTSSVFATLSVTETAISSIEVYQEPTKMSFAIKDVFVLDGLLIKVVYNKPGKEEIITNNKAGLTYTTSNNIDIDAEDGTVKTTNNIGSFSITFEYSGKTTTLTDFSIVAPSISSTSTNYLSGNVATSFQEGGDFSYAGLVVYVSYSNGYSEEIAITSDSEVDASELGVDLSQSDAIPLNGNSGNKTIYITTTDSFNQQVTASYPVALIKNGAIVGATLVAKDSALEYFVGDHFTAEGLVWKVANVYEEQKDIPVTATNTISSLEFNYYFRSAQKIKVNFQYTNGSFVSEKVEIVLDVNIKDVFTTEDTYCKIAFGTSDGVLFTQKTFEHSPFYIKNGILYFKGASVRLGRNAINKTEIYLLFKQNVSMDGSPTHADTYGKNVYTGNQLWEDCIGYVDLGWTDETSGVAIKKAHVVMFEDVTNYMEGSGNIEVTFPHYVEGYADKINKSKFGVVYHNRLFVSGNPNFKNCDWHSGAVNTSNNEFYNGNAKFDYSYFSDLDYCYYGTDETAIVGYDIFRDGELLTIKEGSRSQATIYRRSYKMVAAISYDGSAASEDGSLVEEAFPMFDVNSNGGIGGLSYRSIENFVGDTIVLTRDGVKSITANDDVNNNAKYSKDVSTNINPMIIKEGLGDAVLFSYDQKLYLKTSRGIYVGYYELKNDNGEYEWYFLDNVDADLFFEFDHELYFANRSGAIFRFPKEDIRYKDKTRTYIKAGGTGLFLDEEEDTLVASNVYADAIVEGKDFHLVYENKPIHANLGNFINTNTRRNYIENNVSFDPTDYVGLIDAEDSTITIKCYTNNTTEDYVGTVIAKDLFYEGREIYFDHLVGVNVVVNPYDKFYLKRVNNDPLSFKYYVLDDNGEKANLLGIDTCRLSFVVDSKATTKIGEVDDYENGGKIFDLIGDHERKLDLIYYNDEDDILYSGIVTSSKNVEAYYVTIPYAFGSLSQTKTVWSWTITNDTQLESYMDVGFLSNVTRGKSNFDWAIKTEAGATTSDLMKGTIDKIMFTGDKLPHVYVRYRVLPSINFVRFVFSNLEDSNIVLSAMELVYSNSSFTKGVK